MDTDLDIGAAGRASAPYAPNPDLVTSLTRTAKKRRLWTPGPMTVPVEHGRAAVERLLPHRDPFLFVDLITSVDLDQQAISGRRRIDPQDPLFVGHFPGYPIYPGVLQLETMGQLGICLLSFVRRGSTRVAPDTTPLDVRALKIHTALFQAEVRPNDDLEILGTLLTHDDYGAVCAGQILVREQIAVFAVMEVHLVQA